MTENVITTVDPRTGEVLAEYPDLRRPADRDRNRHRLRRGRVVGGHPAGQATGAAARAGRDAARRARGVRRADHRRDGQAARRGAGEVDKCADTATLVADAAAILADDEVAIAACRSWLSYEPLGVVFAVMPWNYPFWQVLRFACADPRRRQRGGAQALAERHRLRAGHRGAVRPAPGSPPGLFTTLVIADADVPGVSERIIGDARVAAVTLTGSERAGEAVGGAAGRALKKTVLELGGSDPFVVLDDADLARRRHRRGERPLRQRRAELHRRQALHRRRVGRRRVHPAVRRAGPRSGRRRPDRPGHQVGPMARADLRDGLHAQVHRAVEEGATLVTGGHPIDGPATTTRPPCSTTSSRA